MAASDSASASTSISTAAGSNNRYRYDVFLNHRGPDVKKTFASHLYRRLLSHGLTAFLDQDELQVGLNFESQIKEAIRTASLHVAIFSPRYAQSEWCLKELVLMLESGAPIIPVFHQVKPDVVRHTRGKGDYAGDLLTLGEKRNHDSQPRHDSNTVENWRNSLSTVAKISGLELEAFNGDEGELVDKVVEVVLKKIVKRQLNVAKYPTGLDEKVSDLEMTVLSQQHNGRVGITGLGGVGKTTLAVELFNRMSSKYRNSYFLFDVRENAKNKLHSLQNKLLKGLFQLDNLQIDNSREGIEILRKHLSSSQVFLVLDDVDHADQLDALLPVDDLRHDSLILITSRHKDVLTRSRVQESSIYHLSGLSIERSRELFCSHAFCQRHPLLGFEKLVDQFVMACCGLPLSLKVVGAFLAENKDESYWQGHLDELQKTLPDDIQKSLRISYDALKKEEQHIFLDIACFLIGQNKGTAIRIWNASGWNGSLGFQTLLDKCLVELGTGTVNYDGSQIQSCIRMHDHLRDMGRDLAQHSGLSWRDFAKDLGLPSRLWRATKVNYLLQRSDHKATEVRGIRIRRRMRRGDDHNDEYASSDDDDESASASCYSKKKLQLLDIDIEADRLECILKVMDSPNLIWLRWHNCPCSSLPPWIPLKKLRVLELTGVWETLWQDGMQAPSRLQELLIRAHLSNIPKSIAQLKHLERIVVSNGNLKELPEEFCLLPSLKHLELTDIRLRSLPDSFGKLTNLEHIDLSDCYSLERLPISFEFLIKLKNLVLSHCHELTLSSGCFGNISTLEYVDLTCCGKIEVLPTQIAHQRSLEKLDLDLPNLKEWRSAIGEPSSLEKLVLRTPLLETFPSSFGRDFRNLKYLKLQECQSLKHLPDSVSLLNQLTQLTINYCSLQELCLKTVEGESETPSIETMVSLKELQVDECLKLKSTRCSAQLRGLEVSNCSEIEELHGVEDLTWLEKLQIYRCLRLKSIRCSAQQMQLREILLSECSALKELPGVEYLRSLEKLQVYRCLRLKSIRCSGQQAQLRELVLSECSALGELPGVEYLRSLEKLQVYECVRLKSILCSAQQMQLREIMLSECSALEELPGVEYLRSLEKVQVYCCMRLKSIRCSGQQTQLRELVLSECWALEELPGVEYLRSLEKLHANGCVKLKSIQFLAQLTDLREIDVSECLELEELPGVEHLRSLKALNAAGCVKLKSIRFSAQMTSLIELEVYGCWMLESLPGIEHAGIEHVWSEGKMLLEMREMLRQRRLWQQPLMLCLLPWPESPLPPPCLPRPQRQVPRLRRLPLCWPLLRLRPRPRLRPLRRRRPTPLPQRPRKPPGPPLLLPPLE